MANFIQVASTPTADTGAGLMLHFDHRRYLFGNLSEGTQRALTQRKYAMSKLETMFISGQTTWENTGGMIGMMLTVADVLDGSRREIEIQNQARKATGKAKLVAKGPERIEIHGARNLNYTIATARSFIFRKGLPIRAVEVDDDPRIANPDASKPDWADDSINVWKVPLSAPDQVPEPTTSRKRSHEVMTSEDDASSEASPTAASEEYKKVTKEAVEAVVEDMFNSDWSMDRLYETKLHQVQLPATVFIREDGHIKKYKGPLPGDAGHVPDIDVLVRYPWPAARVAMLPRTKPSNSSVCYIVKNNGRRGKFNPVIAKSLGVVPTDFKHLANGKVVKGKDDMDVTPDMVLEAPMAPNGFAVIDIGNASFIDSFMNRAEWKKPNVTDNVHVFFWSLGPSVIDDERIQNFMRERPDVKHVVLSRDTSPNMVALESSAVLLAKLRRIDPDRFPALHYNNETRDLSHIGPNVEAGRVGMKATLMPDFHFKTNEVIPFPELDKVKVDDNILRKVDETAARIRDPSFLAEIEQIEQDIPNRDTEIIPLGTGSALPSKYRNVSSTLIRVPQYGNYILDCGENTLGQLRRAFPPEELTKILQETRCIFISHMHADHHLGTASFVRAWEDATENFNPQPKLGVVGPSSLHSFLMEYDRVQPLSKRLHFIRKGQIWPHAGDGRLPADDPTKLESVLMVPVDHCTQAYAGVLTWPSGLKIAYSGDCRPSDKLVEAGKGATLLIHESTFDDDKRSDALAKKHSTMSEALDVAYRMGARRVLLTHFSQRYAKMPLVDKRTTDSGADQAVLMAFDHMRVKLGEFRQAQAFLPAIKSLLDAENSGGDD
ncbi:Ribonuclease Z 1 [Colletotrichum chlorophyti]|uniref:ribonuclease Z n=1 Tax=Colletotrichum chlorophyti TaxID=708187 RepID=A0A1Q8RGH3_9PEZI|nr:Ribonuclease Z 1 [Colletotrichum chlorophyti]